MSTHYSPRTSELLAEKALFGLDEEDLRELTMLLGAEEASDDGSFEVAASGVELALAPFDPEEALPDALWNEVLAQGIEELTGKKRIGKVVQHRTTVKMTTAESPEPRAGATTLQSAKAKAVVPVSPGPAQAGFTTAATVRAARSELPNAAPVFEAAPAAPVAEPPNVACHEEAHRAPPQSRTGLVVGWLTAAAGFALAAVGWWPQLQPVDRVETLESVLSVPEVPLPAKTAAAMRDDLLTSRHRALKVPWTATGDPAAKGAAGDVVWSNDAQEGYLRFSGLAANNPGEYQYQLWIFDASRDERYPIDGGVFDVESETDDSVVPVAARIRVGKPALFTVTAEKPGGVVVSKRERIVVTAKVDS